MTPAKVIAASVVPGTKSVFFLGCFESRVTLFAQQVRALNLVDALLDQGVVRETGRVAIVGGGAAGVTAAAALARAAPKLKAIDVYERKDECRVEVPVTRHLPGHRRRSPAPGSHRT
jgi:NADH dehydrogenase FAD-containing subunit